MSAPTRTKAIVNPAAGNGRVRRVWPELLSRLLDRPLSVAWTTGPGDATLLTRRALQNGYDRIVAVGGDGTLNEVVNGFFDDGAPVQPNAVLVPVACGTGSDFSRTLEAMQPRDRAPNPRPEPHEIDVGLARFVGHDGLPVRRYFVNVASFGLGGVVVRSIRKIREQTRLTGAAAYFVAILRGLARHRPDRVQLSSERSPANDGDPTQNGPPAIVRDLRIRNVAVANGRFFGGGLQIAPSADLSDGLLDVVAIDDAAVPVLLRHAARFYRGRHYTLPCVTHETTRAVHAAPLDPVRPVWLDLDGEPVGRLPATFEVRPASLSVQPLLLHSAVPEP